MLLVITALGGGTQTDRQTGTHTHTHARMHTHTHTRMHTTHTYTCQCTNQSNFKKPGTCWPVVGACLV